MDRKAELERKKARLQQIREEKKRKEEERKRREAQEAASRQAVTASASASSESDLEKKWRETEDLLKDIGLPEKGSTSPGASKSSVSEASSQDSAGETPSFASPKHKPKLGFSKLSTTVIPPKELVQYSKETQTPVETSSDQEVNPSGSNPESSQMLPSNKNHEEDDDVEQVTMVTATPEPLKEEVTEEEVKEVIRELTEEEKQHIVGSEDFLKFFDRSSRVIERALCEDIDIFTDYAGGDDQDKEGEMEAGTKLALNRQFYDERWSKHRVVTSMDWSPQYPELLVASYNSNEDAPHEPDGVALVWNMKYKKTTPEYIFHCQSAVMSSVFARFHPNLVVGGTYSGQIVLWDNRSNKRTPVQRTPLSAAAHTHPVYCVNVVGTQNAHNLISVSTDGKMCSWSLDMLSQPQDSMELQHKQPKSVAVTCLSFPTGDVNNFVVGSEDGFVYTACRHGSKAGISDLYEGHNGPVTGIDCQHTQGQIDFSHLFLTSSFDWTVKLWSLKQQKPLYSFEDHSDYVYDVKWSPIHPALFACVDGMGRLDLWNLNNDTEVPTAGIVLDTQPAINRIRWTQSGHQIAAGDADGRIWIYDVAESIAQPRNDEWSRFVRTLAEIKANQQEAEESLALSR